MPLISLGDVELHYEARGEGPPVVLLHGLGSSGADWAFQMPVLSRRFRVIAPDLRGSGLSGKPQGPYSIAQFAADLWTLLDHLHVSRCQLVGFSLGGAVALEMALQRPAEVERLVKINSLPSYRVDHWRKWVEAQMQLNLARWLGLRRVGAVVGRRLFPEPHQLPMRRRVEQVVGTNARGPYLATIRALVGWCALDRLHRLEAEALFLSAEHDYTPLEEKRRWAERMGAPLLLVEGSRHGTPFDAVGATNRVLEAFLSGAGVLPDGLRRDSPQEMPQAAPED